MLLLGVVIPAIGVNVPNLVGRDKWLVAVKLTSCWVDTWVASWTQQTCFGRHTMKKPIYSLTRKLGRMSWNKYNLYNIANKRLVDLSKLTLFQQKWIAKRETRAYHGDEVTERQFKAKFFNSKLPTINSGSTQKPHPPVSVLTFAELERRLDFIVFRSNFAPSVYAARQLCVHGKVKVNGKKVRRMCLWRNIILIDMDVNNSLVSHHTRSRMAMSFQWILMLFKC